MSRSFFLRLDRLRCCELHRFSIDNVGRAVIIDSRFMNIRYKDTGLSALEISQDDRLRSNYIKEILCKPVEPNGSSTVPEVENRVLVQFWDDPANIPADVQGCMQSWEKLEAFGFVRVLFGDESARDFIRENFTAQHVSAFDACLHPAMRADYFRLCYILKLGGVYVDADDEYVGNSFEYFIRDGNLRVQALCYDQVMSSMVAPTVAFDYSPNSIRTFYVNNNPLMANAGHPIVADALKCATNELLGRGNESRDIQSITGPGNLSAALVRHAVAIDRADERRDFEILMDWERVAVSKWPLNYRNDGRNWRHWADGVDLPIASEESKRE